MAFEVVMPRLGWTMETGTLVEWQKRDGDSVEPGDVLFTVESDKAVQEIEALERGILHVPPDSPPPGTEVEVGTVLAYLLQPGEPLPRQAQDAASRPPKVAVVPEASAEAPKPGTAAAPAMPTRPTTAISPRARRVARELGVAWESLKGSGRTGRIVERDVRRAAEAARVAETSTRPLVEPVAKEPTMPAPWAITQPRSKPSHGTVPVTLTATADATELVRIHEQLIESLASRAQAVPTYNDLLIKLCGLALLEHQRVNAVWRSGEIIAASDVHIAIEVETESGVVAPVIRDVPSTSILSLADQVGELTAKALLGQLEPADLQGGTFTIADLGEYGVDAFTPIIHWPQIAALGLGRITEKAVVRNGQIVPRYHMVLSLTFDHRVLDGGPAARFLDSVCEYVEKPSLWLVR